MINPYSVLGISPGATDDEVKKAYRNMSRKYHPDANVNNPNKAEAEEKFKEVQAAYDQIMRERQQGYSSSQGSYGGYQSQQREESVEFQAAANYIANHYYKEALNVLNGMEQNLRSAKWYYYSAIANSGLGNTVAAQEYISRAVDMEPSNILYRQTKQQIEYGSGWYRNTASSYGTPYQRTGGGLCLDFLLLNLLCNCFC